MAKPISEYFISLKFDLKRSEFTKVDNTLRQLEKRLAVFQKNLTKQLQMPELQIKNFKFDELALQRKAQPALNRVGRLLEVPISNFKIDEAKLQRQFQNVFQRASNNARINVKSIAGTGGGGNPFALPPRTQAMVQQAGGGFNPTMIGIPRMGGIGMGGLAAGGLGAVAFMGGQQVGALQDSTAQRQTQLLKLRTSGTTIGGQRIEQALLGLSNEIGVNAEGQVDAFSRFLKQTKNNGMSSDAGFDLFRDMSIATRGNGGDQQSIERQAYALIRSAFVQ